MMKSHGWILGFGLTWILASGGTAGRALAAGHTYEIVDTGQDEFFDHEKSLPEPRAGQPFYGQDAQFTRHAPDYTDNGDGTVTDNVTGLVWQKSFAVMTYDEAIRTARTFSLAGREDWRLPSIKELYSLALFSGVDASSRRMETVPKGARPFLADVFDFKYGANGDRPIDTQLLSSTLYRGETMGGQKTVFGFNAADGRIKGYPITDPRTGSGKRFTVRFVRGNAAYGKNRFQDNRNGTISDLATGLVWEKRDSGKGMTWEEALAWAAQKNAAAYRGATTWRLPHAKELQSLVDYERSPQATDSAALSPMFEATVIRDEGGGQNYPFYWTSTTHISTQGAMDAVYISFGEALGFFRPPDDRRAPARLLDVHGAGAQRSDPKRGTASDFPNGRGPQGDVIRVLNYVRLVRDI